VEDNSADALVLALSLDEVGLPHEIHVVIDGDEALEFLNRRGEFQEVPRPHVVLLDVNLPKRSGLEVLREIRASEEFDNLPIFVLSTSERAEDQVESRCLGADRFITKPYELAGFAVLARQLAALDLRSLRASRGIS
jgi:two-component system response regulator